MKIFKKNKKRQEILSKYITKFFKINLQLKFFLKSHKNYETKNIINKW